MRMLPQFWTAAQSYHDDPCQSLGSTDASLVSYRSPLSSLLFRFSGDEKEPFMCLLKTQNKASCFQLVNLYIERFVFLYCGFLAALCVPHPLHMNTALAQQTQGLGQIPWAQGGKGRNKGEVGGEGEDQRSGRKGKNLFSTLPHQPYGHYPEYTALLYYANLSTVSL